MKNTDPIVTVRNIKNMNNATAFVDGQIVYHVQHWNHENNYTVAKKVVYLYEDYIHFKNVDGSNAGTVLIPYGHSSLNEYFINKEDCAKEFQKKMLERISWLNKLKYESKMKIAETFKWGRDVNIMCENQNITED